MKLSIPRSGLTIIIALVVTVYGTSKVLASSPSGDPPITAVPPELEAKLRPILSETCDEINKFANNQDFPLLQTSSKQWRCDMQTRVGDDEPVVNFYAEQRRGRDGIRMLATSGKVTLFQSEKVFKAHVDDAPVSKAPYKYKWTETHAIEIASKFANIFLKPWGKNTLGKPTAQIEGPWGTSFDRKTGEPMQSEGQWVVSWEEHAPSGITFLGNGVRVTISELYGPYEMEISNCLPEAEVEHLKVISHEQALLSAKKGLDAAVAQAKAEGKAYNATGGFAVSEEPTDTTLEVQLLPEPSGGMLPSDLFLPTSLPKSGFLGQPKYQLVWMAKYSFWTANPMQRGYIVVFVDAQDGSVVCCSYPRGLA
jgi:hypothetical protein